MLKSITVRCLDEEDVINISKAELKSGQHYFVFENFDDKNNTQKYVNSSFIYGLPIFAKLVESKNPVILNQSSKKIYNLAFSNFIVCASNTNEKSAIANLVELMNGKFTKELTDDTTHLVTNTTKSAKYDTAARMKISIYHIDWIKRVYRETKKCKENWSMNAETSFSTFLLPPFFELSITTTDIPMDERTKIQEIVEDHGGKFEQNFTTKIDVLIVGKRTTYNAKFQKAQECMIPCLDVKWIHDSVKANYALPYKEYFVKPKKQKISLDSSQDGSKIDIVDTSINDNYKISTKKETKDISFQETPQKIDISHLLDSTLTSEKFKKAENIFDGLIFYIYDFAFNNFKKMKKILTAYGAFCTSELDENVTHIICWDIVKNSTTYKEFTRKLTQKLDKNNRHTIVVKCDWIFECIKEKCLVPLHKDFRISDDNFDTEFNNENNNNNTKVLMTSSGQKRKFKAIQTTPEKMSKQ